MSVSVRQAARLAAVLLFASAQAWAGTSSSTPGAAPFAMAARIDGQPISLLALDVNWEMAHRKDAKVTRASVLESLVQNRLMAQAARKRYTDRELHPGQRVAFNSDVAVEDRLTTDLRLVYENELNNSVRALAGGKLDALIQDQTLPSKSQMERVFGKSDGLRLEFSLTAEQIQTAQGIIVLRYTLTPGKIEQLSLADVYHRQNVQGRAELFRGNLEYLQNQTRQVMAKLYTLNWAEKKFGSAAVADLRQTMTDQEDVTAFMELHGIGDDIDSESPVLKQLATQVSNKEVASYYQAHKSEFVRVDKVKARHIRLNDEQTARKVADAAAHGEDFANLAKRYSVAPDASKGGDLGWLIHNDKPDWLSQIAFIQQVGKPSSSFRAPVGPNDPAYWEIVLVENRIESFQAPNSEAVRYAASKAIARDTAHRQFEQLRAQLMRKAHIEPERSALEASPQLRSAT